MAQQRRARHLIASSRILLATEQPPTSFPPHRDVLIHGSVPSYGGAAAWQATSKHTRRSHSASLMPRSRSKDGHALRTASAAKRHAARLPPAAKRRETCLFYPWQNGTTHAFPPMAKTARRIPLSPSEKRRPARLFYLQQNDSPHACLIRAEGCGDAPLSNER